MFELKKYQNSCKNEWDILINKSRNGSFLFYRDYLEYHSDRFQDCSFLVLKKGKLIGVIPGNVDGKTYYSHQGLTYGGLVTSISVRTSEIIEIFNILNITLKENNIEEVIYKPIPFIYHKIPSQEDIYALFLLGAVKIGCNISSTIYQNNKIRFIESRKSGIRKSLKNNVIFELSNNYEVFWQILNNNLTTKFNKKPVHNLKEIKYLSSRFPQNIKLYTVRIENEIVAGSVIYEMNNIVHVQYISANEKGKEIGALDLIFDKLINSIYLNIPIFDFGQSTEHMGQYLNQNLIFQKEGFGGRGVVYDIYKYSI